MPEVMMAAHILTVLSVDACPGDPRHCLKLNGHETYGEHVLAVC